MQQSQWDSWYWSYHAAAKRADKQPLPQSSGELQQAYRQWCADGTPTPEDAVSMLNDGTS